MSLKTAGRNSLLHSRRRRVIFSAAAAAVLAVSSGCPLLCVSAGTQIETVSGTRSIDDLKQGDFVKTARPLAKSSSQQVLSKLSGWATELVVIRTDHSPTPLSVTPRHRVALADGNWLPADRLLVGDQILSKNGPTRIVDLSLRRGLFRVYDMHVSETESYFADGILVHNKSVIMQAEGRNVVGTWVGRAPDGLSTFYSVTFNGDNNGSLVCTPWSPRSTVERYQFRWSLKKWTVTLSDLKLVSPEGPPRARGLPSLEILNAEFNVTNAPFLITMQVRIRRDDQWNESDSLELVHEEALRDAMDRVRLSPAQ